MTAPPPSDTGLESGVADDGPRYEWLTPDRQATVRIILLGIALFAGLVVWVWHSLGPQPRPVALAGKLRVVGVMTWLYALMQITDMRFWHSSTAEKRRIASGIPESVIAWLLVTFAAFPIRRDD
jgi:hypothetical protein